MNTEQRTNSSKSESSSSEESKGAILEVKPGKDTAKTREEQSFKKLKMVCKGYLKIQGEWRRPVLSYKEVLETSSIKLSLNCMNSQRKAHV